MTVKRAGEGRRSVMPGLILPLVLALLLVSTLAVFFLLRRAALTRSTTELTTAVEILSPLTGDRLLAGDEHAVLVWGTAADSVVGFEFWVDGVLEGRQEIDPALVSTSLSQVFTWRPRRPGVSVLIARMSDRLGRVATSKPLRVEVLSRREADPQRVGYMVRSGDSLPLIAEMFGVSVEDLTSANSSLMAIPDPGSEILIPVPPDRLPVGYDGDDAGQIEPSESINSLPRNLGEAHPLHPADSDPQEPFSPPAAPSAFEAANEGGCDVGLTWADISDSESSFRVYRFGSFDSDFQQVAAFSPNVEFEGLTFQDRVPLPGTYEYFIAARNAAGEGASPIRSVEISEGDCPWGGAGSQAGVTSLLQLEVLNLTTSGDRGQPYCYFSHQLSGDAYVRLPAGEDTFLEPDEDGWNIKDYAGGSHATIFATDGESPIPVAMECWAWQGDQVVSLGSFVNRHPRSEWDVQPAPQFTGIGEGFRADYSISPIRLDRPLLYVTDECPSRDDQMFSPSGSAAECDGEIPTPYNVRRPGDDLPEDAAPRDLAQECVDGHIDVPDGARRDGAAYAGWACILPEHVVIWEWDGDPAAIEGYQVSFEYTRPSQTVHGGPGTRGHVTHTIGSMAQLYWIPRFPQCEETLTVRVYAFAFETIEHDAQHRWVSEGGTVPDPPNNYFIRTSPNSQPYSIYGPPCPHQAEAQLILGRLQVDHSRDVDGLEVLCFFCEEDHTQEAYGVLRFDLESADGSRQEVAVVHFWTPDDPRSIHNGNYPLQEEEFDICKVDQGITPVTRTCRRFPTELALPGFNMFIEDGERLVATLVLQDWDGSTGDDVWCNGVAQTPRYTAQAWAEADIGAYVDNSEALFRGDQEVYCYVDMHIDGLGLTGGVTPPP